MGAAKSTRSKRYTFTRLGSRTSASPFLARWYAGRQPQSAERDAKLEKALWHLLRAETSCNFYWGEDWVYRCHQDLDAALEHLHEGESPHESADSFK